MTATAMAQELARRLGAGDAAQLAGPLAAALDRIRRQWPAVPLTPHLVDALAARIGGEPPEEALGRLYIDDLFLADACARGDARACEAFAALVERAVSRPVGALAMPGLDTDEIRQLVCERLLVAASGPPRIARYSGAVRLRSWVRVIAARIAIDDVRRRKSDLPLEEALACDLAADAVGPDLAELRARYRAQFKVAVQAAIGGLPERDRNVLRFTVENRLTADQIGRLYGVHRVTVARWLRHIRDALTAAIVAHLGVDRAEMDSMLRLIRSQVSLSIERILGAGADARG